MKDIRIPKITNKNYTDTIDNLYSQFGEYFEIAPIPFFDLDEFRKSCLDKISHKAIIKTIDDNINNEFNELNS